MEWFYTEEDWSALKKQEQKLTAAFRILVCLAAAAFIVLCLLVRTENAQTFHWILIAVTLVLGWICISLHVLGIQEARTQAGHLDMLLQGEKEMLTGRMTLTDESIRIPKSIRIRKVLLDTGEETPKRLNLDERWISRMPADGSLVSLPVSHSYIAGVEILEEASPAETGRVASRRPARAWKLKKLLPLLGIWTIAAVIFSSFVFYQITDTDPGHKLTVYVDGEVRNEAQLAARLEKSVTDPVRMVKVHPFTYALFGSDALKQADLYIVPASHVEEYRDWFAPLPEEMASLASDRIPDGIPVFDPAAGLRAAGSWILYNQSSGENEPYFLFFGRNSMHLSDHAAAGVARALLTLAE